MFTAQSRVIVVQAPVWDVEFESCSSEYIIVNIESYVYTLQL